jgi:hypothetical protein
MGLSKKTKRILIGVNTIAFIVMYAMWKSLDLFNQLKDDPFEVDFDDE